MLTSNLILLWFISWENFVAADRSHAAMQRIPNSVNRNSTLLPPSNYSAVYSHISFRNLTSKILPTNTSKPEMTNNSTTPRPQNKYPKRNTSTLKMTGNSKMKPNPCPATVPRMNLHLNKIMGAWYPVRFAPATAKLWTDSLKFGNQNATISNSSSCFLLEYATDKPENETNVIHVTLRKSVHSTTVDAILIGDDQHPKGSKWAIAWPNGEDTLTSVVAAGVFGKERNNYNWLLMVDCDLNGIIESDWAVMARVAEGFSNATLSTIFAIVEGLHGLKVKDNAITSLPDNCHN